MAQGINLRQASDGHPVQGTSDGDALLWDATKKLWFPNPVPGGSVTLSGDTSGPSGATVTGKATGTAGGSVPFEDMSSQASEDSFVMRGSGTNGYRTVAQSSLLIPLPTVKDFKSTLSITGAGTLDLITANAVPAIVGSKVVISYFTQALYSAGTPGSLVTTFVELNGVPGPMSGSDREYRYTAVNDYYVWGCRYVYNPVATSFNLVLRFSGASGDTYDFQQGLLQVDVVQLP